MNPATLGPRPAGAPAYYLGRPASAWLAAVHRRRRFALAAITAADPDRRGQPARISPPPRRSAA